MIRFVKSAHLELAVVAFCAWQAADLVVAWRHSPFDRWGWLGFVLWLAPVAARFIRPEIHASTDLRLAFLALTIALLGRWIDLNALLCVAFAVSLAALAAPDPRRWWWLVGAIAWMPVLGWLAAAEHSGVLATGRLLIASGASAVYLRRSPAFQTR